MMSFKSTIVFITAIVVAQAQHVRHLKSSKVDKNSSTQNNFEICAMTKDQDCNYSYLREKLPEGKKYWIVMPGGDTKCLDGSPFGFQVFPGETNKLMLWFQGGGACFNYHTCVADPTALTRVFPNEFGIFNMSLDGNPLVAGEWATVVNNYCSGDFHAGDSTPELTSPDELDKVTVFHNGHNNTMSVLTWIKRQPEFPSEQEIASGGCSAYIVIQD